MAHEINNPLGGLFNALDTLKTHGETPGVRDTSISLIERGLAGIRDVVEAALATYRPERSQRLLTAEDFDDVRLLLKPELRRRRQRLDWDMAGTAPGSFRSREVPCARPCSTCCSMRAPNARRRVDLIEGRELGATD